MQNEIELRAVVVDLFSEPVLLFLRNYIKIEFGQK